MREGKQVTTMTHSSETYKLFEVKPGIKVPIATLKHWLPDVETALFFAKAYDLDYQQLSRLLVVACNSSVMVALSQGNHSLDLQDYIVDTVPQHLAPLDLDQCFVESAPPPKGEILPELWKQLEVVIATSIKEVTDKLHSVLATLPSKEGKMMFSTLAQMNHRRNLIGDYKAQIHHAPVLPVLVILDVSGSMTSETVRAIVDDCVDLAWTADAHFATVSNQAHHWEPGTYSAAKILDVAAFGGTHYEQLAPLLDQDWGTVITIADYDSSYSAKQVVAKCKGRIGKVLDISLVGRPTFLAECVGELADEVQPILIATGVVSNY